MPKSKNKRKNGNKKGSVTRKKLHESHIKMNEIQDLSVKIQFAKDTGDQLTVQTLAPRLKALLDD